MATWVPKAGSILTACAFVFSVSATPTIIDPGPDPFGDLGLGPQDVLFVAEARNVDHTTGDWEIGLGHYVPNESGGYRYVSDANTHLIWENNKENTFTLCQEACGTTIFSVGDKAVSAKYEDANDIFVESVTRDGRKRGGEYVEVYNCSVRADISSFNKKDLKDVAVFVDHPEASGLDYALDIAELKDDKFKCMEGTIVFSWTGKPPKRSYSEVILKGFKTGSVPEPTTVAFLALGAFSLVGMGTRGRKKK